MRGTQARLPAATARRLGPGPWAVRPAGSCADKRRADKRAPPGSVNLYMVHGGTNFGYWAGACTLVLLPELLPRLRLVALLGTGGRAGLEWPGCAGANLGPAGTYQPTITSYGAPLPAQDETPRCAPRPSPLPGPQQQVSAVRCRRTDGVSAQTMTAPSVRRGPRVSQAQGAPTSTR